MVRSPGSGSLWNWSLVGDLRRPHAGGGPARVPIRFPRYPVFKVPGASSAPPRRFLPSAAQGDILRAPPPAVKGLSRLFPGKGRLKGRFRRTTWDDTLRLPFGPRAHFLHKPRKGAGRRECDPAFRGASPQGAPLRPTATPLAMQRGRATLVAPGLSNR